MKSNSIIVMNYILLNCLIETSYLSIIASNMQNGESKSEGRFVSEVQSLLYPDCCNIHCS